MPRVTSDEFWSRVGRDETGTTEFKESLPRASRLQEPLVAFANARGGVVVIGVGESRPRTIVGLPWGQEQEERVQEVTRITHPPLPVGVEHFDIDGRVVTLLRVEAVHDGWVMTSDGRTLVRAGPTNRVLVGNELYRFLQARGSEPVEDEPVRSATVGDLDAGAIRSYVQRRLGRRVPVERALQDLGFLTPDGHVRLAALLLFGREPQRGNRRFGIDVVRYDGVIGERTAIRQRLQLVGPLFDLVAQADRVLYEEMRRDAVIRGLVREEVPEFPPVAIREALLNAVGHRDYSLRGSSIEVRVFDDGLEIESPGGLAGYVTVENLRDAQYSRNERIMEALQVLGLVEEAGTGIDRMYAVMENALLDPPEFTDRASSFVVLFRGRSIFAVEDRLWIAQFSELNLNAHAKVALVFARRQGTITNEGLRALRRLDTAESRTVLQELVARELLQSIGRGRGTRYVLGELALRVGKAPNVGEQLRAVAAHAQRAGAVANRDVRGLLGVDAITARTLLEQAVARGLLTPIGERRGRRYLPTDLGNDKSR